MRGFFELESKCLTNQYQSQVGRWPPVGTQVSRLQFKYLRFHLECGGCRGSGSSQLSPESFSTSFVVQIGELQRLPAIPVI